MEAYRLFPDRPLKQRGYQRAELERIASMIAWSAVFSKGPLFRHKLHKLLFYSDRLSYEEWGKSLSGLCYITGPLGPIPERADLIYEVLVLNGLLQKLEKRFPASDYFGTAFLESKEAPFRSLEKKEQDILEQVVFAYKQATPGKLIDRSLEDASIDELPFVIADRKL